MRLLVEPEHPELSLRRQCELLGLSRASLYYRPAPASPEDLQLMRLIDGQYTECPFYGSRRMTAWLERQGEVVNRKRVQRLMRLMGLEAIYPKPRLSVPEPGRRIFPYLLRGVEIGRADQVWSTDITYVPMAKGFMYLAASSSQTSYSQRDGFASTQAWMTTHPSDSRRFGSSSGSSRFLLLALSTGRFDLEPM